MGHLIAQGDAGGLGNPAFLSSTNRSPKWAMRRYPEERVSLARELMLLTDVGLVGMPNACKSTLLCAHTGARALTEVAGYAFTALNPVVGVMHVAADGSFTFSGDRAEGAVHDETRVREARERKLERGQLADALTRSQRRVLQDGAREEEDRADPYESIEAFWFTVVDNLGLIEDTSADVGRRYCPRLNARSHLHTSSVSPGMRRGTSRRGYCGRGGEVQAGDERERADRSRE